MINRKKLITTKEKNLVTRISPKAVRMKKTISLMEVKMKGMKQVLGKDSLPILNFKIQSVETTTTRRSMVKNMGMRKTEEREKMDRMKRTNSQHFTCRTLSTLTTLKPQKWIFNPIS